MQRDSGKPDKTGIRKATVEELLQNSTHDWVLGSDGKPDDFAYCVDPTDDSFIGHNGYKCKVCDYTICVHCLDSEWEEFESECEG